MNLTNQTNQMNEQTENELNEIKEDLRQDLESERPKRGRKSKEQIQKEEELKLVIGTLGSSLMGLVVSRLPNPMPLSDVEKQQVDIVTSNLLSKYMSYLDKWQEETAFITVMLTVIIPRTNLLNIFKKKNTDKKNEKLNE